MAKSVFCFQCLIVKFICETKLFTVWIPECLLCPLSLNNKFSHYMLIGQPNLSTEPECRPSAFEIVVPTSFYFLR